MKNHATVGMVLPLAHYKENVSKSKALFTHVKWLGLMTLHLKQTGLTDSTFKQRFYGHSNDFKKSKNKNKTMLSKYIWYLKENRIPYQLNWSILGRAKSFNPVTGVCRLCLLEKYFILYNPKDATLNSRDELFNTCRHKRNYTLAKAWVSSSSCQKFFYILSKNDNISFRYRTFVIIFM